MEYTEGFRKEEMGGEDAAGSSPYIFRAIRKEEAKQAAEIERICFAPEVACKEKSMIERAQNAPEFFLVAEDRETGKIAGFLNGIATKESKFRDEFFMDISLHDPQGENVMLLGLDVLPKYRGQGLAKALVREYVRRERELGRRSLILTCENKKIGMYKRMGFVDQGISASVLGGVTWYEMTYDLLSVS